MDTENEIARDAYYDARDAGKPRCRACGKTERETDLVWCGYATCDESICAACATETEWQLEACCDTHAAAVARHLMGQAAVARREVYRAQTLARDARAGRRAA